MAAKGAAAALALVLAGAGCAHHHQTQQIPYDPVPAGSSSIADPYEQHFLAYSGAQQDWPTRPGSLAKVVDGVPIYYGYPAQPYAVLGVVQVHELNERRLALSAKAHQAEAVIIASSQDQRTGTRVNHGMEWYGHHWRLPSQDTFHEETENTTIAVLIRSSIPAPAPATSPPKNL